MKTNLWKNNIFMAILSIIIIVAIVFLVTSTNNPHLTGNNDDSTGAAYSTYSQKNDWTKPSVKKTVTIVDPSEYYTYMH